MKILLHICCSNCALYPIKILESGGDKITGFWYNPNIHPHDEYLSRLDSVKRLADKWNTDIHYIEQFQPGHYFNMFGIDDPDTSDVPPFPDRCESCYMLRLEKTAIHAKENGFDAFTTTLLISPYQDFEKIEAAGRELENKCNVEFYMKDFTPHFRDAMALAKDMGLYRQKYCGCIYSKQERKIKKGKR